MRTKSAGGTCCVVVGENAPHTHLTIHAVSPAADRHPALVTRQSADRAIASQEEMSRRDSSRSSCRGARDGDRDEEPRG